MPCKAHRVFSTFWMITLVSKESLVGLPMRYMRAIIIVSLVLTACGNTSTIRKTFDHPLYTDSAYSDILIIAVAGDYDDRAVFERAIVSRIKAEGAHATAYYTVVGRHQPITHNTVSAVVTARGYRAVLLARVLVKTADSTLRYGASQRQASRAIDLLRYDYDELNIPTDIVLSGSIMLSAELFHTADEKRMWAIESPISDMQSVGQLLESAADTILYQLRKDRLIAR